MSHLLSSGRRCYVVLEVIVAALSLLADLQTPVEKNNNKKLNSQANLKRNVSWTKYLDLNLTFMNLIKFGYILNYKVLH